MTSWHAAGRAMPAWIAEPPVNSRYISRESAAVRQPPRVRSVHRSVHEFVDMILVWAGSNTGIWLGCGPSVEA